MSNQVGVVLVEEEEADLVDPVDPNAVPARRTGRFLKPRAVSAEEDGRLPLVQPLLREVVASGLVRKWPPEVVFSGWSYPLPLWNEWVRKLRPLYDEVWIEAGIHDPVLASTYVFRRDDGTMLGLLECWCPETNTFVLPWALGGVEVTITLEDVMILGGYAVIGEPVAPGGPLTGEAEELLGKLVAEHRSFRGRSMLQRVSHVQWMEHHMQAAGGNDSGSLLEHAAFLSLWLSRFVFPRSPGNTVRRSVFHIAVRLVMGTRMALAPAVLASVYRDLRLMKQRAVREGISGKDMSPIAVWAPFQILQLWAWERFVSFRPEKGPRFLHLDEPRAARWHCSHAKRGGASAVKAVLQSPNEFQWRPYAANVDDWGRPSFYKHVGRWFTVGAGDDDGLWSLLHCLRACMLVGLHCVEGYNPHRVAMQFGLDQDIPGRESSAGATWELTWSSYDKGTKKAKFYVPSQFCVPRATKRFFKWQKEWISARVAEVEKIAIVQVRGLWKGQQLNQGGEHDSKTTNCIGSNPASNASTTATSAREQPADMDKQRMRILELSSTYTEKETQSEGANRPVVMPKFNEVGEDHNSGNQLTSRFEKSTEDNVGADCEDSDLELFIIQELEKIDLPCKSMNTTKRRVDDALRKERDLEFDREIQKLKREIAELEDKVMKLESNGHVENEQRLL